MHPARILPGGTIAFFFLLGFDLCGEAAETGGHEKSRFNLFHPTPENLWRELATDRPDKTEGPTTVDAGHFQFEMDFATWTRDRADGVRTDTWNVAPFNLRIGLLNSVELSLVYESYVHVSARDERAQTRTSNSGGGDFISRLKINLWGNDGGSTAAGLLPFVKFPASTGGIGNDSVEGGALFLFGAELPWKFDLGMETGIEFLRNEGGGGYAEGFINSVTVSHDLIGKLRGYAEFFSEVSTERGAGWVGTVDFGFTYALHENVQLDLGCNVGVTRAADDLNAFTGISFRF